MNRQNLIEALTEPTDWAKIFNFELYPIHQLDTAKGQALVASCREHMKKLGACELPGFVRPQTLALLQAECAVLEQNSFFKRILGNAYLMPARPDLPSSHPLNRTEDTHVGVVAYDQFPEISLLKRIYEYAPLMNFIGTILELPAIFRYGCPMGGLNLAVMQDKDYLRWHFDQTDFVTSLAIQAGEHGGNFEYVPMIRSASQENYDEVSKVLDGDRKRVVHLENRPGTLVLFQGRYSLHRVTPIGGNRPRWIGLFGYDSKPDVMSTPHLREIRYGRQTAIPARPQF